MSVDPRTQTSKPAAGWYRNPAEPGVIRYWDGANWTANVRPDPVAAPPVAATPIADEIPADSATHSDGHEQVTDSPGAERSPYRHWDGSQWLTWNGTAWQPEQTEQSASTGLSYGSKAATAATSTTAAPQVQVSPESSRRSRRRWLIAAALGTLLIIASLITIGVVKSSTNGRGYLDPNTLSLAIQLQATNKMIEQGITDTSMTVTCIETSQSRQFKCIAHLSGGSLDGTNLPITATVSQDGQSYVTSTG